MACVQRRSSASRLRFVRLAGRLMRRDDGTAAAEFAMVLPVLVLLVFGILQYGMMFYAYGSMNNAAREGARALAVGDVDETGAETLAADLLVDWLGGATITAENADTTGTDFVRVRISIPGATAGLFSYAPSPSTLVAEVQMREEG